MEASALHAPAGFARARIAIGTPLLRLRSDEQLVALFRAGDDDAFRVIHDRYSPRLFAYARQMLSSRQDAEDVLQEVFVRAYSGLRHDRRDIALRAWLYRVAHNRCIDELRRPPPPSPETLSRCVTPTQDPVARAEERDSLRRLISDLRRLPGQQRSALLMRELGGMSYDELSLALAISVPAVKSVLVRARVSLAQAVEARETACDHIREELILAHDERRRPGALARRHLRDCGGCREFRGEVRGVSRQLAALTPALGPLGVLANALGFGGGGAAAGTGAAAGSGALTGGGVLAGGVGHVATLLAAAAVTAGGAAEIQHTLAAPIPSHPVHHAAPIASTPAGALEALAATVAADAGTAVAQRPPSGTGASTPGATPAGRLASRPAAGRTATTTPSGGARDTGAQPLDGSALDPGMGPGPGGGAEPANTGSASSTPAGGGTSTGASTATGGPGNVPATGTTGSGASSSDTAGAVSALTDGPSSPPPGGTATGDSTASASAATASTPTGSSTSGPGSGTGSGPSTTSATRPSSTSHGGG